MIDCVEIKTMVDEESGMASVAVTLFGKGDAKLFLEGEIRNVSLGDDGTREDFYLLSSRLWQGTVAPELYVLVLEDEEGRKEYPFGLRNIGLDNKRGFFLSTRPYPLDGENTLITDKPIDLYSADRSGKVAVFAFRKEAKLNRKAIAEILNHPSLCFLGFVIEEDTTEEEMRRTNSLLYSLDKTRPTMGIFRRDMKKGEEGIFDVSLVSSSSPFGGRISAIYDGNGFAM